MVSPDKYRQALWALNWVLVAARTMAYGKANHTDLADVLDAAEYLPCLMLEPTDKTSFFREYLADLARRHPSMQTALDRFDNDEDPYSGKAL